MPTPARTQTDKKLFTLLQASTLPTTLWVQEESGTIQTVYKPLMAALIRSCCASRMLLARWHRPGDHTPDAALLPGHSHVVHIRPRRLLQHLI